MSLLRPPTQGPTPPPRRVLPPVAAALPSSAHQAICLSLACPSPLPPRRGDEGARPVSSATSANATTVASGDEFPMNFVPFRAFFLANFGECPKGEGRRNPQRVEKVGIELIATINQAPRVPEPVRLMPDSAGNRASREFFNTLSCSTHLVNKASSTTSLVSTRTEGLDPLG